MGRRIGFVLSNISQGSSRAMWRMAAESAVGEHSEDALFIFPGGRLGYSQDEEALRNGIYDLVGPQSLDGAIIWATSMMGAGNPEICLSFVKRVASSIPAVSMCMPIEGVASVDFDAYGGVYEAVRHLVEKHGEKRIAFLRGPERHRGAVLRYRAYCDALSDCGIAFDPKLVSAPRGWNDGAEAMEDIIRRNGLSPRMDFTAIVAASDLLILGAERILTQLGLRIPEDIAVVGFNDNEENRQLYFPLTTVQMPIRRLFSESYSIVSDSIDGNAHPSEARLIPTRLIIRRSCGCPDSFGGFEAARAAIADADDFRRWLSSQLDDLQLFEAAQTMLRALYGSASEEEAAAASSRYFEGGGEADAIIEAMKWCDGLLGMSEIGKDRRSGFISALLHDSRKTYAALQSRSVDISKAMNRFKSGLLEVRSAAVLPRLMQSAFAEIGISSCFLFLYEDFHFTKLAGGFSGVRVYEGGLRFPRSLIHPSELAPIFERGLFVIEPVFYDSEELGYLVIGTAWCDGYVLEDIRASVSSALKGFGLFSVAASAAAAAETKEREVEELYARIAEGIREPLASIRQMVSAYGHGSAQMLDEISRAEMILEMSFAEIGAGSSGRRLVPMDAFLKTIGCRIEGCSPLPSCEIDPSLSREMILSVLSAVHGEAIEAGLDVSGARLSIRAGEEDDSILSSSLLRLSGRIASLQGAKLETCGGEIRIVFPYPSISGRRRDGKGLLWLSSAQPPSSICSLPRASSIEDASLLGWMEGDGPSISISRIASEAPDVPLLIFSLPELPSLSSIFDGPSDGGAVIYAPHGMDLGDGLLAGGDRIVRYGAAEDLAALREKPDLLLLSGVDGSVLHSIRHSRLLESVPLAIISDAVLEDEAEEALRYPSVLLANTPLLASPEFSARLLGLAHGEEMLPPFTGALVKRAIAFMNRNLQRPMMRWQIAEAVNISEDYLTRIFRREEGISPWDYLQRCRIGLAMKLLRGTGSSIGDIAASTGFSDKAYFCRVFRRIAGTSPLQYRQNAH